MDKPRIVLIDEGRVVAEGRLDSLREQAELPEQASLEEVFVALTDKGERA